MSEPTLDDLRVPCEHGRWERHQVGVTGYGDRGFEIVQRGDWCPGGVPAEFDRIAREQGYVKAGVDFDEHRLDTVARGLGYVKVDGIDVEALREARGVIGRGEWRDAIDQVLAALDGGQE